MCTVDLGSPPVRGVRERAFDLFQPNNGFMEGVRTISAKLFIGGEWEPDMI